MTDYTPTTKEVRAAWIDAHRVDTPLGGRMDMEARPRERIREFDRWMASVLAEQGEWEYVCDGKDRHGSGIRRYTDSLDEAERLAGRGYAVRRRTKAIPAAPWPPVEENKHESTDGRER